MATTNPSSPPMVNETADSATVLAAKRKSTVSMPSLTTATKAIVARPNDEPLVSADCIWACSSPLILTHPEHHPGQHAHSQEHCGSFEYLLGAPAELAGYSVDYSAGNQTDKHCHAGAQPDRFEAP